MEHPLGRILNQQISKRSGIVSMVEESLRVFPGQTVGSEGVIWIQTELVQFGVNISPKSAVADLQADNSDILGCPTGKTHARHEQVHTSLARNASPSLRASVMSKGLSIGFRNPIGDSGLRSIWCMETPVGGKRNGKFRMDSSTNRTQLRYQACEPLHSQVLTPLVEGFRD